MKFKEFLCYDFKYKNDKFGDQKDTDDDWENIYKIFLVPFYLAKVHFVMLKI